VRRDERLRDSARGDEVETVGHRRAQGRGREHVGRVAPAPEDAEDAVARPPRRGPRARGGDGARELEPTDVRGRPRGSRVSPPPLQEVGPVEPRARDLDEDLVGDRLGRVALDQLEPAVDDAQLLQ
jgi:hypothetical protein